MAHNGEINAIRGNRNWAKARKPGELLDMKLSKFKHLINESAFSTSHEII